jgi:hypothetical protein
MQKKHTIKNVSFQNGTLSMTIDGEQHCFELNKISPRLVRATTEQREHYEVSPAGYGIHWPLIDEDLSIDGLLAPSSRTRQLAHA